MKIIARCHREVEIDKETLDETASAIPSELAGPLPRKVQFSDNSIAVPIVILLLMVIGCLWYCTSTIQSFHQRSALRQDGIEASGLVTSVGHRKGPDVVHYTFEVKGTTFSGTADIPREMERHIGKSDIIPVRYLSTAPNANHPAAWEWEWDGSAALPILIMVLVAIATGAALVSMFRSRRVFMDGTPASGVVTSCRSGGRGSTILTYDFRTQTGTTTSGSANTGDRQEVGASVWVLYLADNPKRNTIYPSSTFYVG